MPSTDERLAKLEATVAELRYLLDKYVGVLARASERMKVMVDRAEQEYEESERWRLGPTNEDL